MNRIQNTKLSKNRRAYLKCSANQAEISSYFKLAGYLIWLGYGSLPRATYARFLIQQQLPILYIEHFMQMGRVLNNLKKLKPVYLFMKP